jgi:hypothetical protein
MIKAAIRCEFTSRAREKLLHFSTMTYLIATRSTETQASHWWQPWIHGTSLALAVFGAAACGRTLEESDVSDAAAPPVATSAAPAPSAAAKDASPPEPEKPLPVFPVGTYSNCTARAFNPHWSSPGGYASAAAVLTVTQEGTTLVASYGPARPGSSPTTVDGALRFALTSSRTAVLSQASKNIPSRTDSGYPELTEAAGSLSYVAGSVFLVLTGAAGATVVSRDMPESWRTAAFFVNCTERLEGVAAPSNPNEVATPLPEGTSDCYGEVIGDELVCGTPAQYPPKCEWFRGMTAGGLGGTLTVKSTTNGQTVTFAEPNRGWKAEVPLEGGSNGGVGVGTLGDAKQIWIGAASQVASRLFFSFRSEAGTSGGSVNKKYLGTVSCALPPP